MNAELIKTKLAEFIIKGNEIETLNLNLEDLKTQIKRIEGITDFEKINEIQNINLPIKQNITDLSIVIDSLVEERKEVEKILLNEIDVENQKMEIVLENLGKISFIKMKDFYGEGEPTIEYTKL